jgi:hypothetical protein
MFHMGVKCGLSLLGKKRKLMMFEKKVEVTRGQKTM